MATSKIQVNGSSSGYDMDLQSQITAALLQNGGVKRIEDAFRQRLDEAGWSQHLREYVERLFRSGDATSYDDAMKKVMAAIKGDGPVSMPANTSVVNGVEGSTKTYDLRIPRSAQEGGADAVRRELEGVCEMGK